LIMFLFIVMATVSLAASAGVAVMRPPMGPARRVPGPIGPIRSVAEANQHFLTQWGPTRFNTVKGAPDGYYDCGPTSWLMASSVVGLLPHPTPGHAEAAIVRLARLAPRGVAGYGRPGYELVRALPPAALAVRLRANLRGV